jgi:hypothetical protein
MTRTATLVAITLLSAIAAPVVVNATTPKTNAVVACQGASIARGIFDDFGPL